MIFIKKILKYLLTLFLLISIYLCLLSLSGLIPKKMIYKNTKESAVYFLKNYDERNFTDAVMLDISYNIDNTKPLKTSLISNIKSNHKNHVDFLNGKGYISAQALAEEFQLINTNDYKYTYSYARFWHGYLIFLRPLLTIFNYQEIRYLTFLILIIFAINFIKLIYSKFDKKVMIFSLLALLSINYFSIFSELCSVLTIIIMLVSAMLLIKFKNKHANLIFFITGSTTIFFSWMTTPLLTFGFPAIFYFLQKKDEDCKFQDFFILLFLYCSGFILTWIIKWLIVDLFYNTNIINNSFKQITMRASNMVYNKRVNILLTCSKNLFYFLINSVFALPFITICILEFQKSFREIHNKKIQILLNKKNIIFIIIGILPIVNYLFTINHSFIHAGLFTNRLLMLTFFSMFAVAYDKSGKGDSIK